MKAVYLQAAFYNGGVLRPTANKYICQNVLAKQVAFTQTLMALIKPVQTPLSFYIKSVSLWKGIKTHTYTPSKLQKN